MASVGAVLTILGAMLLPGCSDSFKVDAPYEWVWDRATGALIAEGFEMVTSPDAHRMIPASSRTTGRAWFTGTQPDGAGWNAPRIIEVTIEPVQPPETAPRTVTVKVEDRSWVAKGNVPDPEMRTRVTWILRQALDAPGTASPHEDAIDAR